MEIQSKRYPQPQVSCQRYEAKVEEAGETKKSGGTAICEKGASGRTRPVIGSKEDGADMFTIQKVEKRGNVIKRKKSGDNSSRLSLKTQKSRGQHYLVDASFKKIDTGTQRGSYAPGSFVSSWVSMLSIFAFFIYYCSIVL